MYQHTASRLNQCSGIPFCWGVYGIVFSFYFTHFQFIIESFAIFETIVGSENFDSSLFLFYLCLKFFKDLSYFIFWFQEIYFQLDLSFVKWSKYLTFSTDVTRIGPQIFQCIRSNRSFLIYYINKVIVRFPSIQIS